MKRPPKEMSEESKKVDIPIELIWNILLVLPASRIVRFKDVSRNWAHLIDNPRFIKTHLQSAIQKNRFNLMLTDDNEGDGSIYNDILAISYEDYTKALMVHHPYKAAQDPDQDPNLQDRVSGVPKLQVRVSGSCNGLIYLQFEKKILQSVSETDSIVEKFDLLWNPSTSEFKKIAPNLSIDQISDASPNRTALGYSASNDDYYVVTIYQFRDAHNELEESVALLYTLSTNSWKLIPSPEFDLGLSLYSNIVTNSNPVWLAADMDDVPTFIVGFDMETETFDRLHNPPGVDTISTAGYLGGCLSILVPDAETDSADIWLMRTYRAVDSWERAWTIQSSAAISDPSTLMVLFYHGDDIVFRDSANQLVVYNPRDQRATPLPLSGLPYPLTPYDFYFTIYVGTLVSLKSGIYVASPQPAAADNRNERRDGGHVGLASEQDQDPVEDEV